MNDNNSIIFNFNNHNHQKLYEETQEMVKYKNKNTLWLEFNLLKTYQIHFYPVQFLYFI